MCLTYKFLLKIEKWKNMHRNTYNKYIYIKQNVYQQKNLIAIIIQNYKLFLSLSLIRDWAGM